MAGVEGVSVSLGSSVGALEGGMTASVSVVAPVASDVSSALSAEFGSISTMGESSGLMANLGTSIESVATDGAQSEVTDSSNPIIATKVIELAEGLGLTQVAQNIQSEFPQQGELLANIQDSVVLDSDTSQEDTGEVLENETVDDQSDLQEDTTDNDDQAEEQPEELKDEDSKDDEEEDEDQRPPEEPGYIIADYITTARRDLITQIWERDLSASEKARLFQEAAPKSPVLAIVGVLLTDGGIDAAAAQLRSALTLEQAIAIVDSHPAIGKGYGMPAPVDVVNEVVGSDPTGLRRNPFGEPSNL